METFEVNGQKIPLELSLRARRDFEVESGVTLNEFSQKAMGNQLFLNEWICLLWACLKAGAKKHDKQFAMSCDAFLDYLDSKDIDEEGIVAPVVKYLKPKEKN